MSLQSDGLPGYKAPGAVIAEALDLLLPPDPTPVDAFAAEHRYLTNAGGYTGRFSFDPTPYLRLPTGLLGSAAHNAVIVVGPGQSAKTTIAENWLCHAVAENPANFLWYMQTDPGRDAYVKSSINPMIEQHRFLHERIGRKPMDNSLIFKRFDRMTVEFLGASTGNLINKKAANIVADEVDAYDPALGDPKALFDVRRQTFMDFGSMLLAMSHPDRATGLNPATDWARGIMAMYADSDRRLWWWQCPQCGEFSSPAPIASAYMRLDYPEEGDLDEIAGRARLICPRHGCTIENRERAAMNTTGLWAGLGETVHADGRVTGKLVPKSSAGFWIVGAMSPFIAGGIGGLARARVKAKREFDVDSDWRALKEVVVKSWGFPFSEKELGLGNSIDSAALKARAGGYQLGTVPEGVRYPLAFVDVQHGRFVVQVEGQGPNGTAALIDRFDLAKSTRRDAAGDPLAVDPAQYLEDWHLLIDQVVTRSYPLADGSGRAMRVKLCAVDSGGEAGVTELAYEFHRHLARQGLALRCLLIKGDGRVKLPRAQQTFPDSGRKDRKAGARGEVPVYVLNSNVLKDGAARLLRGTNPERDYMRFPEAHALPEGFFEEYGAEKRTAGVWTKERPRNEAFDAAYVIRALRLLVGGEKIDWNNPPAWAAPWDRNDLVITAPGHAAPPPPGAPVSTAAAPLSASPALALAERLARMNNRT